METTILTHTHTRTIYARVRWNEKLKSNEMSAVEPLTDA